MKTKFTPAVRNTTPPTHDECLSVLRQVYKILEKRGPGMKGRREKAMAMLREANDYYVETYNMLKPKAGKLLIHNLDAGGCCDPSTETYHCM
jgi:hypothetical protein